ncbi:Lrp/AsnC ligand binding domain-containing protein [Streptomyces sp. NBC_00481]|uniref:Lrp/AsnC ligand binding domain-containing protein n=1 Tax=Streptomyces sp. NBC_00481 TaxID=2975755 RepID=UPI003FA35DDE
MVDEPLARSATRRRTDATREDESTSAAFDEAVAAIPDVPQAQRRCGDTDCLVHSVAADLADYRKLHEGQLTRLPGVRKPTFTIVMTHIVEARPFPTINDARPPHPARH